VYWYSTYEKSREYYQCLLRIVNEVENRIYIYMYHRTLGWCSFVQSSQVGCQCDSHCFVLWMDVLSWKNSEHLC